MSRLPRIAATISIVLGVIAVVLGVAVYVLVHNELADQKITVSDDAPFLAGDEVDGPFSAYAEAMAINDHALEAGGGLTYAELPQDDPKRDTVMTADFLQASLFTSVVAFGVAALVAALGVVLILFGFVFRELDRRTSEVSSERQAPTAMAGADA
jgi:hypothetical protein